VNKLPLHAARDSDLRLSHVAMLRAAQRAREVAAKTGTAIVISRNGVIERLVPSQPNAAMLLKESERSCAGLKA
jgi:cell division protein FtsI/penicillin-binding protein 2